MLSFVAKRLAMLVVALLTSSFIIFAGLQIAPGDPIAALSGGRALPPQAAEALREQYHLDEGLLDQYWHWLTGALQGDLGTSIVLRVDVSSVIAERAAITAELVAYAALIIVVVGIGLGTLAGLKRGPIDTTVLVATSVAAAVPSFLAAVFMLSLFSVSLGWFPSLGAGSGFVDRIQHLTLPAIALAISAMAIVARITRTSVRGELGAEHVQTAVSRGVPRRLIVRRHVLRNAAIPITTVTGLTITSLIATAAVVETAFSLGGLGSTLVKAASQKDMALVQGISLVLVAAFLICNTIVDLIYGLLDPRVAVGSRAQ